MPASGKKAKVVKKQAVKVTAVKKKASVKVKAAQEKGQEKAAKVGKAKASKAKSVNATIARPAAKKATVVKEKAATSRPSSKASPKAAKTSSKSAEVSPKSPKDAKKNSGKTTPKATKTTTTKTLKTDKTQSSSNKTPPKAGKTRVKKTPPDEKAVPKTPEDPSSPQAKAAPTVIRRIADEPRPSDPLHVSDAVPYICHFAWMFKGVLKCGGTKFLYLLSRPKLSAHILVLSVFWPPFPVSPPLLRRGAEQTGGGPCQPVRLGLVFRASHQVTTDSKRLPGAPANRVLTASHALSHPPLCALQWCAHLFHRSHRATCFPYDLLHELLMLRVTAMHADVIEDGKGGEGRGRKRKRGEGDLEEEEEEAEELEESEDEGDEGEEEEEEETEGKEESEEEEEEEDEDPFEFEPRGKGLMEELFAPFEYIIAYIFSFLSRPLLVLVQTSPSFSLLP
jgi:hypothetical protein